MRDSVFFRLGTWVHRLRWGIIVLTTVVLIATHWVLPNMMTAFHATGFVDETSRSAQATQYLDAQLGYHHTNQLLILYHSDEFSFADVRFNAEIKRSLRRLDEFPVQYALLFPDKNPEQRSADQHTAYVAVVFFNQEPLSDALLEQLQALIKRPKHLTLQLGGEAMFTQWINKQTQNDLYKADKIAAPIAIIVLIGVFGSVISALLPLCLGGGCALIILSVLYGLGQVFSLSIFTVNIALLLGLCLCLDYSLFIVSRFRNELDEHGSNAQEAICITMATAGRAVFFSGLAVFVSLSALLIFPINILFSVGVGGLVAALMAVLVSLIALPAVLSVLKQRINWLPIAFLRRKNHSSGWRWLASLVVNRPKMCFVLSLVVLFCLAYPFSQARFGIADFHIFPEHSASRKFFDQYSRAFNANELTPIELIVSTRHRDILSAPAIAQLLDLTHQLQRHPGIASVTSLVTLLPGLSRAQYQALYAHPEQLDASVRTLLKMSTSKRVTVMHLVTKTRADSSATKALIRTLRTLPAPPGMRLQWAGDPVINLDVQDAVGRLFPYALVLIMGLTYVILLVVMRSLFLPLKAIFMNTLSLSACYGMLVYIFQQGHLHRLLNFEPQGMLDMSLMIIIFCAIFGFSMDYEVFLLTRIQEYYRKTGDNKGSIVLGIEKSARIISSAAVIVICICSSFMVADILIIKEFGLGIAVAIFVDAFIIRTILVPSTMTLIDRWNWYLPNWLSRILP